MHVDRQRLTAAKEVALGKADVQTQTGRGPIAGPKAERARGRFGHGYFHHFLVGGCAGHVIDLHVVKEPQRLDAFGGLGNLTRVQRIAFDSAELAAHNGIQRGCVAFNINAFHKDARAFDNRKGHIHSACTLVARHARFDRDKVQTLFQRQRFQRLDIALNDGGRIGHARAQAAQFVVVGRINAFDFRDRFDLTHGEALAFGNGEGHKGGVTFARIGGPRIQDLEIQIAPRQIEICQHLLIGFKPIDLEHIALDQIVQNASLLGRQDLAQPVVREIFVAHKADAGHFGDSTFDNLKHHIDGVVGTTDDARRDGGGHTAIGAVGFSDDGSIGFGHGGGIDLPGFFRGEFLQIGIFDQGVALVINRADHRVFDHFDQQAIGPRHQNHPRKQARSDDALIAVVQCSIGDNLALGQAKKGHNRGHIDLNIALNRDGGNQISGGHGRQRFRRGFHAKRQARGVGGLCGHHGHHDTCANQTKTCSKDQIAGGPKPQTLARPALCRFVLAHVHLATASPKCCKGRSWHLLGLD